MRGLVHAASLAVLATAVAAAATTSVSAADIGVPATLAAAPAPRVGECFDYGPRGMDRLTAVSPSVPCGSLHTAEVYKVAKWSSPRNPYAMTDDLLWEIGNQKCRPQGNRVFDGVNFNYWAYFLPTRSQWNAGQRWIRCDALLATSTSPLRLDRWRGSRL